VKNKRYKRRKIVSEIESERWCGAPSGSEWHYEFCAINIATADKLEEGRTKKN